MTGLSCQIILKIETAPLISRLIFVFDVHFDCCYKCESTEVLVINTSCNLKTFTKM